ncbi:ABC transporter ATP-binding protein [Haladaptatus cibarius]|uniref:ABC transporter ATP-binding protein n=1 Tax=Haladaptatus cibarius TaxID=453847 RepID=UPI0006792F1B|nr:ABC transporter ATP-binding protein [Haladaptatus cibarius]
MTAIETRALTKRFGEVTAVHNLDLTVKEGEIFGLLGPNGAGKSTTLNLLLDFLQPTAGDASVLGRNPWMEARTIRERMGILPEGYGLYDRLTAREHLEFVVQMKSCDTSAEDILERIGLVNEENRPVGNFSKGMRQRLGLGIALVGEPDLLILDEPSSGFDPHGIREMRSIIREEKERGATVIFSSHVMQEVKMICDRVGIMNHGELIAVDTIEALHEQASTRETLVLSVDMIPESHRLTEIDGVSDVFVFDSTLQISYSTPEAKTQVLDEVNRTGTTIRNVEIEQTSLEELFVEYTAEKHSQEATI